MSNSRGDCPDTYDGTGYERADVEESRQWELENNATEYCPEHPDVPDRECEICNCRNCGDPIDPAACALGSNVCSSCRRAGV